tara:strand:+ start:6610 stop:7563 length:954 start_codon:yes stop_codon:yes gene_type:complete
MECKNCNQSIKINDKFCSTCGQKNISKLNVKFVFGEVFQTLFNIDSKVFRSLRFLIFKPGYLTKEYLEGKRVSYLPPIRIYLALSFLYFFLISVVDFEDKTKVVEDLDFNLTGNSFSINKDKNVNNKIGGATFNLSGKDVVVPYKELKRMHNAGTLQEDLDSLTAEMPKMEGYFARKSVMISIDDKGFYDLLRDQLSIFLILFLPFFALLYGLIFRKSKKGFIGHLIFNLHLNSFLIFMMLTDLFVEFLIGSYITINIIWGILLILSIIYYLLRSLMIFYNRKWWAVLYKFILLLLGYGVLAILFLTVIFIWSMVML